MTLVTKRLRIRELQPSDWDALEQILCEPEVTRFMYISPWATPEGRRRWFDWCLANQVNREGGNYNWGIVLKPSQTCIGWLGIGASDRREIEGDRSRGYMIARAYWGRGFMTEALVAVLDYEFNVLDVPRVVANCETENLASARVMEKAGMRFVRTVYDADPLAGNLAERHHFAIEKADFE